MDVSPRRSTVETIFENRRYGRVQGQSVDDETVGHVTPDDHHDTNGLYMSNFVQSCVKLGFDAMAEAVDHGDYQALHHPF